ncbi:hypothetical protein [Lacrimispora sp.]|uniref:hypothetical protein n=1 Tax=Lacrimispora sp. TaxID=2719234 RepID=UPI003995722E
MRKFKKESQTVAVAGCLGRIGTTTQAIQIVKYLSLMGYRCCYVEMNRSGYIDGVKELYNNVKEDRKVKRITYEHVDMFRRENIAEIGKLDYEFLVKDYGSVLDQSFEKISFLEQNFRIFCGGIKPGEINCVYDVLSNSNYRATGYIFSFVPNVDREAIKEMMDEKKDFTFFCDYVPDAYLYSSTSNQIYRTLLNL